MPKRYVVASIVALIVAQSVAHAAGECTPSWDTTPGQPGMPSTVSCLTFHEDDDGPGIIAGGSFQFAGDVPAAAIARWNGTAWSPLGSGLTHSTSGTAICGVVDVCDLGDGPAVYATGSFDTAGGNAALRIAKWNGTAWSALGSGLGGGARAMACFDDGNGAALYVGGSFQTAGGVQAKYIAKWDGTSWSPLANTLNGNVNALAVFDDGTGPALYVAGGFLTAGVSGTSRIAKWNGRSWSALASGVNGSVEALAVYDDGTGAALYASGSFTSASPFVVNRIAKWNGTQWSAVGGGLPDVSYELEVFDDGNYPALYAIGGTYVGEEVYRIARWNGVTWTYFETDISAGFALAAGADSNGPALFVGGLLGLVSGMPTQCMAALRPCTPPCRSDFVNSRTFLPPGDNITDGADLAFLLGEWGLNPDSPADIVWNATLQPPADGFVGAADLAYLLSAWGLCR